jgi:hypothetical protein
MSKESPRKGFVIPWHTLLLVAICLGVGYFLLVRAPEEGKVDPFKVETPALPSP